MKRVVGIAVVTAAFVFFLVLTALLARHLALGGDAIHASADSEFGLHAGTLSFGLVPLVIGDVLLGVLLFQALRSRRRD